MWVIYCEYQNVRDGDVYIANRSVNVVEDIKDRTIKVRFDDVTYTWIGGELFEAIASKLCHCRCTSLRVRIPPRVVRCRVQPYISSSDAVYGSDTR